MRERERERRERERKGVSREWSGIAKERRHVDFCPESEGGKRDVGGVRQTNKEVTGCTCC